MGSKPLGIDMKVMEHDGDRNNILQTWTIRKARFNIIEFGNMVVNSKNWKTISVELVANEIELDTMEKK